MKAIGLIPARGGSKGIPGKNLAELGGKPLIAHTIRAARASRLDAVYVSSDDSSILETAERFGAMPVARPAEFAIDAAPAVAVMRHFLQHLQRSGAGEPGVLVYLQPTSPFRSAEDINAALALLESTDTDTVVSVVEVPHNMTPGSQMVADDGVLRPYLPAEAGILQRQDKPRLYARNGPAVLALRSRSIAEGQPLYAGKTVPLVMPYERSLDIDTPLDLDIARLLWPKFAPA